MKKKISVILMCAVMLVVLLMLFSCSEIEKQSAYGLLSAPKEEEGAISLKKTFEMNENEKIISDYDNFFLTREYLYDNDNQLAETVYRFYTLKGGFIKEERVKPNANLASAKDVYGVNLYTSNGVALLAKTYCKYQEDYDYGYNPDIGDYEWLDGYVQDERNSSVTAYDIYGNAFLTFEPDFKVDVDSSTNFELHLLLVPSASYEETESDYLYYEKKIYKREDNGRVALYKDLKESGIDVVQLNNSGNITETDGGYVFTERQDSYNYDSISIIFFDKDFNYMNTFEYSNTSNENVRMSVLANGNVFINKTRELGSTGSGDYKDFSYYSGDEFGYECEYEIYIASTGELVTASVPSGYVIYSVSAMDDEDGEYDSELVPNLATARKIEDGFINNKVLYFAMDNDGNFLFEIDMLRQARTMKKISDDVVMVELPYAYQLYKTNGAFIGAFDKEDATFTKSYIVYDDKILDFNLETVFKVPDNYTIEEIYDQDVVIFSADEADGTKYYKWSSTGKKSIQCDELYSNSDFYYTVTSDIVPDEFGGEKEVNTYKYYSANGKELFSYDDSKGIDSVEVERQGDAVIQIINNENTSTFNVYYAD